MLDYLLGMLLTEGNNEYPTAKLLALGLGTAATVATFGIALSAQWVYRKVGRHGHH